MNVPSNIKYVNFNIEKLHLMLECTQPIHTKSLVGAILFPSYSFLDVYWIAVLLPLNDLEPISANSRASSALILSGAIFC